MAGLGKTFLIAVTKETGPEEAVAQIWVYTDQSYKFEKESCIPVYNPVSLDAVFASNNIHFLAIASGSAQVDQTQGHYLGAVFIYKLETLINILSFFYN
jgi:hypothetical protein